MRNAAIVFVLAALLAPRTTASAQSTTTVSGSTPDSTRPVPPGRLVDLGGYRLHLYCTGQGTPTVVLSAGAGDFATDWALVQPEIAKRTRVCSYDRSGEAWSERGPAPRSIDQEVYDLHRLLVAAGERGPYVLAGQSLGGMVVRLFAQRYRTETAGLVLVDAFSEDAQLSMNGRLVRMRELSRQREIPLPRDSVRPRDRLSAQEEAQAREFMTKVIGTPKIEPPFDRLPPAAQRARLWALAQPGHYAGGDDYLAEITARVHEETSRVPHPLDDLPLVVLARTRDEYPQEQRAMLSKEHREQQQALAKLSTTGTLQRVERAGHHIQLDQPEAVVAAVLSLVKTARPTRP
jgi:pimeloyl-ACP methyl ester carboxylesterase